MEGAKTYADNLCVKSNSSTKSSISEEIESLQVKIIQKGETLMSRLRKLEDLQKFVESFDATSEDITLSLQLSVKSLDIDISAKEEIKVSIFFNFTGF